MKSTARLTVCCLIATLLPALAFAQPVPDQDTLLLLQFDGSTDADYSIGTPSTDARVTSTDSVSGRFNGGIELGTGDRISIVGDDGNTHPSAGTIEFWCRLRWDGNDVEKHSFLSAPIGEKEYININCLGKGRLGIAISARKGNDWVWRRADFWSRWPGQARERPLPKLPWIGCRHCVPR